ncbi:DUF6526 family protein [Telmatobacter bradus]|uniref:DUF6526 family protein n=1 Tax=Telmatobacter bradus TaxID=474953 RepID=UPI003B43C1E4
MSNPEQSLKNHARFDFAFHGLLFGVLAINFVYACIHLYRQRTISAEWFFVLSIAVFIVFIKLRTYPLKVQDRLIRLEERLRLQVLAPAEFQPKILLLSEDQLIGLRFASDAEVVSLAAQALEESLDRGQIKERIKNWRADDFRI